MYKTFPSVQFLWLTNTDTKVKKIGYSWYIALTLFTIPMINHASLEVPLPQPISALKEERDITVPCNVKTQLLVEITNQTLSQFNHTGLE